LRHSQYRIRDLLRLSREVVEHEADQRQETVESVLIGRGGRKISEKSVRDAVAITCKKTSIERILEGDRRFPGFQMYVEALRGISVPFDFSDLKRRLDRRTNMDAPSTPYDFRLVRDHLWSAGVLGLRLSASTEDAVKQVVASFGNDVIKRNPDNRSATVYLFEHSCEKSIGDIINTFDTNEAHDIFVKPILHPMMFEFLDARVKSSYPIGI
jgi:hypothetical protein